MDATGTALAARKTTAETGTREGLLDDERTLALGRLTLDFAHELRNALTGVRCYLELLAEVDLPVSVRSFVGDVDEGLERITQLSSRWLEVARGAGATASISGCLAQLVDLLDLVGVRKRIAVDLAAEHDSGYVQVEPRALQSVLVALLGDLIERAPSRLRISTERGVDQTLLTLRAVGTTRGPARTLDHLRLAELLGAAVRPLEAPDEGWQLALPVFDTSRSDAAAS